MYCQGFSTCAELPPRQAIEEDPLTLAENAFQCDRLLDICSEKKHEVTTYQPEILADHGRQQSCMEICYQTKTMR